MGFCLFDSKVLIDLPKLTHINGIFPGRGKGQKKIGG